MLKNIIPPILFIAIFVIGCSAGNPNEKSNPYPNETHQSIKDASPNFPWQDDPKFIQAQKEHGSTTLISSYHATLPDPIFDERHNISLAADYLCGALVKPNEVFSLNSAIGWRSAQRGFKLGPMYSGGRIVSAVGGGVCKIASVIYNVVVLANLEVIERHPHSMIVPYVPPGQDATISYGTKDFRFRNTTDSPILIWSQNTGGTLYIAFYGTYKPPIVTWTHNVLVETPTWTEYVNDHSLPKGTEKLIFEGFKGITVHSKVTISDEKGNESIKDLGISSYRPSPRVVAVGR